MQNRDDEFEVPDKAAVRARDSFLSVMIITAGNRWFRMFIIFLFYLKMAQRFILTLTQDLDRNLSRLTASFERAIAEKVRCQEEVNQTNKTIELANKLVKELEASPPLLPEFYLEKADQLIWILSFFSVSKN